MINYVTILDSQLNVLNRIFKFRSCIWTTQYYDMGEFELIVDYTEENWNLLKTDYFVVKGNTNQIAIIERIRYEFNPDDGGVIIASGRMAISLLNRRLIYEFASHHPWIITVCYQGGNIEDSCRNMVYSIFKNSTYDAQKIGIVELGTDHGFTDTSNQVISTYRNMYSCLSALLGQKQMSHRFVYDAENQKIRYDVFKGTDRSEELVFSRGFQNLLSFAYEIDKTDYKNAYIIGGDGESYERFVATAVGNGYSPNIRRREVFYDASSGRPEGATDSAYSTLIKTEAKQACKEYAPLRITEAEIDLLHSGYEFGVDFDIGDIVLINDIVNYKPRITTVIESQSDEGYAISVEFDEDIPDSDEE